MTHAETEAPRDRTEAPRHAAIVRHHFRSPWGRVVQAFEIGARRERRELLDLVHHEVPWLPMRCHPPGSTHEARNGEPLRKMLVRMPIVMLGDRLRGDIERQEHRGGCEGGEFSESG